tara:strand:- start:76 stop:444 length:369 start_codon:yes stop_codon:yes gene_type:complete
MTIQEKRQNVIDKDIYCLANTLAEKLLTEYYDGDYILANALAEKLLTEYYEGSEYVINVHNDIDENDEYKEVYQYFIVSDWFAEQAIENGDYIIETQDLFIWGRECYGISLADTKELDFMFS